MQFEASSGVSLEAGELLSMMYPFLGFTIVTDT